MRRYASFIMGFFLVCCLTVETLTAQTPKEPSSETPNPVEQIEEESNGNITIDIPPSIMTMILQNPGGKKGNSDLKSGINKMAGYRIQVFSDGRNQSTLESRARARGNMILSKFPKYKGQIYTYSSSPNWFTRIGNFRTASEANSALTELKKAFPNFSSEMRIVKSQIVVIK
ncbi:MAG: SPOR domain-containing protein [Muribaculaceae bacterium]|nr:SPOR domain-containing protein [Muribaculaceae bacterium]